VHIGYRGSCDLRAYSTVWRGIMLNCPAAFMATNAAHAVAAFEVVRERASIADLSGLTVRNTLEGVQFPACCEVFPGRPTVVLDGAHNALAAASLSALIRTAFEGQDRVLVIGIPRDKQVDQIIAHFADAGAGHAIFTRYPGSRAASPEDLVRLWRRRSAAPAWVVEQPEEAWSRALALAREQGVMVITGSIHLAGVLRPMARTREAGQDLARMIIGAKE